MLDRMMQNQLILGMQFKHRFVTIIP